jgi:hypothetical protein
VDAEDKPAVGGDLSSEPPSKALDLMAAEYSALRIEIGRCQDHQKDLINLAFVLLGGTLALTGVVAGVPRDERGFGLILLLVPLLYALLGLTCADRARRMLDLARYIDHDLRCEAELGLGKERAPLWRWEEYKRQQWEQRPLRSRALALGLDKARWLVFIVPNAIAVVAYWRLVGFSNDAEKALAWADALVVAGTFLILLMSEETSGLKSPLARLAKLDQGER